MTEMSNEKTKQALVKHLKKFFVKKTDLFFVSIAFRPHSSSVCAAIVRKVRFFA